MRERNIKKWTAEDLNKELHVQTLGPVEHFLAKEGYSAEDLMRPIGDEQPNQVIMVNGLWILPISPVISSTEIKYLNGRILMVLIFSLNIIIFMIGFKPMISKCLN